MANRHPLICSTKCEMREESKTEEAQTTHVEKSLAKPSASQALAQLAKPEFREH